MFKKFLLIASVLIMFTVSCKKGDSITDPGDNNNAKEAVITDTAVPVDEEIRNNLTVKDTSFTFALPSTIVTSKKIAVNDILIEKPTENFPHGYLRKITRLTQSGNETTIKTSQATLKDVIKQGSIRISKMQLGLSKLASIKLADGLKLSDQTKLNKSNKIGIDWDYSEDIYKSGNNIINIKGAFLFDLNFNFDLDVEMFDVKYFKTSFEINQSISLGFKSNLSRSLSDKKIPFATAIFDPVTIMVGIVPVVLVPEVTLYVGADGQITANCESWCRESFTGEYGLQYKENKGWSVINSDNFSLEKEFPKISSAGKFSFFAGPEASLKLYGVAGPYLTFDAFTDLEINSGLNYNYKIGFRSNAGVKITLLGWELLNTSKKVFEKELFKYTGNGSDVPPGIKITNPAQDQDIIKGDFVIISTYYSGPKPNSVKFYIDNAEKTNISTEPFEYKLATENLAEGNHTVKAVAVYTDKTIESSIITFKVIKTSWTKVDLGSLIDDREDIHKIYFVNENLGFITGGSITSSFILKTTNGGNTWSKVLNKKTASEDYPVTDIVYISGAEMYAITQNYLYRSTDNGLTWAPYTPPGEIYSRLGGTKMCLSSDGLVITSYNSSFFIMFAGAAGSEWKETTHENSRGDALAIKFLGGKRLIVLDNIDLNKTDKHQYHLSSDGGISWTTKTLNIPINWEPKDMDFVNDKDGWIVGHNVFNDRGFVLKTTDGGNSWQVLVDGNKEDNLFALFAVDFIDHQYGFTAGSLIDIDQSGISWHQGITATNNGGINWSNSPLKNYDKSWGNITAFYFFSRTKGWAGGDAKTLYKYGTN